ncbi:hypothetical protein LTR37_010004 [Vermiconidia calcicola]|uniref:Uncharacterized protein n=1 Tax=Vermiconidia calcicola TaxID=1690605 RepID=A0ACC3N7Z6_9PEZI|nr:hypothetical protein LTR37_010004 [Vermiconidia calcicola]
MEDAKDGRPAINFDQLTAPFYRLGTKRALENWSGLYLLEHPRRCIAFPISIECLNNDLTTATGKWLESLPARFLPSEHSVRHIFQRCLQRNLQAFDHGNALLGVGAGDQVVVQTEGDIFAV